MDVSSVFVSPAQLRDRTAPDKRAAAALGKHEDLWLVLVLSCLLASVLLAELFIWR